MPSKRHTSEQIITKLREAEVHLSQGMTIPLMCKKLGIHQQTYYKWRREYGVVVQRFYSRQVPSESRAWHSRQLVLRPRFLLS